MSLLKKIMSTGKTVAAAGAVITLLIGLNLTVKAYEIGYLKLNQGPGL